MEHLSAFAKHDFNYKFLIRMDVKQILIIDDEAVQAQALTETIKEIFPEANVFFASGKEDIEYCIENKFYNLVLLDLRMDCYEFDGMSLAQRIIEINPFSKILFVSKFIAEYMPQLSKMLARGEVIGFSEKRTYDEWKPELKNIIEEYYFSIENEPSKVNAALLSYYMDLKNENDAFKKGKKYEDFIAILFRSIGFQEIMKRVKDESLNEVDLVIRNDIKDEFLSKFGKYILIECKNKPDTKTDKNDYIVFHSKLENASNMAELVFLFTTSSVTRNTYIEAARNSKSNKKVIIIDNVAMSQLLQYDNLKEGLKKIIDSQVKDN